MKYIGGFIAFLLLGVVACFLSAMLLSMAAGEHHDSGSLLPLWGLLVGVPTWIISFGLCYAATVSNPKVSARAFGISVAVGFASTIAIPLVMWATGHAH